MSYCVHSIDIDQNVVYLVDNDDGGMTITNRAEEVVADVLSWKPGARVIYRDTDGLWNELVHENGEFRGWRNAVAPLRFPNNIAQLAV